MPLGTFTSKSVDISCWLLMNIRVCLICLLSVTDDNGAVKRQRELVMPEKFGLTNAVYKSIIILILFGCEYIYY